MPTPETSDTQPSFFAQSAVAAAALERAGHILPADAIIPGSDQAVRVGIEEAKIWADPTQVTSAVARHKARVFDHVLGCLDR